MLNSARAIALYIFTLCMFATSPAQLAAAIKFTNAPSSRVEAVVDVRPLSQCQQQSLSLSICLPIEDLLADNQRLANFSGLYWLAGTLGLTGSEHIAVVGDNPLRREFVAGWLYVAGQTEIELVTQSVSALMQADLPTGSGTVRANTRKVVYTAQPRTHLLVLKTELLAQIQADNVPVLLDGRTEGEYWGQVIKANRGGHLPGALHRPSMAGWQTGEGNIPIAYAHDSVTGLAYLARLAARQFATRLYLGGWLEWAADTSLAVDAESFPNASSALDSNVTPVAQASPTVQSTGPRNPNYRLHAGFMAALLLLLVPAAYYVGRKQGVA